MKMICFIILFISTQQTFAHPGVGIVVDSKNNIYYTDLEHVWKLTPDGKKSIAVRKVHTHELYIDANDNLYGEHLWYNGERINTWGHYVWCFRNNNKLDTVKGPSAGFLKDYSFVRDKNENMYWVERDTISSFKKKSSDGNISVLLTGKFTDVRWMHTTKKGIIYFIDLDDLYKINTTGKLLLIAKNISGNTPAFSIYGGKHSLMGIWSDSVENIYVANFSGQVVKRISKDGKEENFVYSNTPWSPTGGAFDNNGNLWLLEYSLTNKARVRKIIPSEFNKAETAPVIINNYILPVSIIAIIFLAVIFLRRFLFNKKNKRIISLA